MRRSLLGLTLVLLSAAPAVAYQHPNAALTPGERTNDPLTKICTRGNATSVREDEGDDRPLYDAVMTAYHIPYAQRNQRYYRLDHLWPLWIGGAYTFANLWPQPTAESFVKDRVERALHASICYRRGYHGIHLSPEQAERELSHGWDTTDVGLPAPGHTRRAWPDSGK